MHDLGIIVRLIGDGDVLAAIDVINKEADFVYGIGVAPEGALMVALALSAGGNIKTKLISPIKQYDPLMKILRFVLILKILLLKNINYHIINIILLKI